MKGTFMHALLAAVLIYGGCVNCPNAVTNTIGTNVNVLGSAAISNGILIVTSPISSNQFDTVNSTIGTNNTPTQLILTK